MENLSYCGLYCGACPSYQKGTCLGCRSEDKKQNRKSKWGCKIRLCCHKEKELEHCGQCEQFPCNLIDRKLIKSHPGDPKFTYRHEIPKNVKEIDKIGIKDWLTTQKDKWSCPDCGHLLSFYYYKCNECGKVIKVE